MDDPPHVLVNRAAGQQVHDLHRALLADTVEPVLTLAQAGRIPGLVDVDYYIRRRESHSVGTCLGRDEQLAAALLELLDSRRPLLRRHVTVEENALELARHQLRHLRELGEGYDLVSLACLEDVPQRFDLGTAPVLLRQPEESDVVGTLL